MAKLDRIKIKGFKSIKEADIPLTKLNVLIGANGAGKSNFISVFKFFNALKNNELDFYVGKTGGASRFLYFGHKITDKIELFIKFNNGESHGCHLYWAKGNEFLKSKGSSGSTPISSPFKFDNNFISYHLDDTSFNAKIKTTPNINDNEYLKYDGANLSAYLYFIKEKYSENYSHILKTIQLVAPFIKDFKLRPNPLNPETIRLEWIHKGQEENYFNISDFSDGTLRFICLATLLLQPNPPETIIIDEPELGLHPFAITVLADLIKQASVDSQIIISTQSTNLVDKFEPKDIIVVDRENDASVFKRLDEKELKDWLEDYTLGELWQKNVFGGRP